MGVRLKGDTEANKRFPPRNRYDNLAYNSPDPSRPPVATAVASLRFASESRGPESMAWHSTADLVEVLCTRTEPSQLVEASKQWGSPGRYVREVMPSDGGSFREMASGGGWLAIIAVAL